MKSVTKKVRKLLKISQSDYNNKMLFIKRKLNLHLKKNGIRVSGVSFLNRIKLFREITLEEPFKLNKYESYKWLLSIWQDGSHDIIRKTDPLNFYFSDEWRNLRRRVLDHYGEKCAKCGGNERISVDHIKPRSLYPELELDFDNMQVLCTPCNSGKSNKSITDYRKIISYAEEKK